MLTSVPDNGQQEVLVPQTLVQSVALACSATQVLGNLLRLWVSSVIGVNPHPKYGNEKGEEEGNFKGMRNFSSLLYCLDSIGFGFRIIVPELSKGCLRRPWRALILCGYVCEDLWLIYGGSNATIV